MNNMLFFGDSLTAGYGLADPSSQSYPALIQQRINTERLPYHVINAGQSGDTSAGGLARIDYWLARPITAFVLELGINDVMRGTPPQTTAKNLQAIIDKVKTKYPNCKLALMGMDIPVFIPGQFAAAFRATYSGLAKHNQMTFVQHFLDGVAGNISLNLPDRIHPTAEGYKVIADKVWPVLRGIL